MTVYVLFPDNLGNSDYIVNLVQLMELIIMPLFFFLFFVWMFLFVLCGYSPVTPNKIVNPSECCSLPHGHAFSSIFLLCFGYFIGEGPSGTLGCLPCTPLPGIPSWAQYPVSMHFPLSLFDWLPGEPQFWCIFLYLIFVLSAFSGIFFWNASTSGARPPPLNLGFFLFL